MSVKPGPLQPRKLPITFCSTCHYCSCYLLWDLETMQNKFACNCIASGYAQTTNFCPVHKSMKSKKFDSKTKGFVADPARKHSTKSEDSHDIAWLMVKQLANKHIKVNSTWEGAIAQRYWYLEANKMIKEYIRNIKNCYKNIK